MYEFPSLTLHSDSSRKTFYAVAAPLVFFAAIMATQSYSTLISAGISSPLDFSSSELGFSGPFLKSHKLAYIPPYRGYQLGSD